MAVGDSDPDPVLSVPEQDFPATQEQPPREAGSRWGVLQGRPVLKGLAAAGRRPASPPAQAGSRLSVSCKFVQRCKT